MGTMKTHKSILLSMFVFMVFSTIVVVAEDAVTYDGRSLMIKGKRELLVSGSIHYPRSTPDMWPDILEKARHGGLNLIQTYVFWNIHEPVEGQFNFEGNYDVVKFIKMIGEHGMWVTLRIGPFIEAEWNHGGFPYWLREVNNITFRSDNEPYKYYMKKYVDMIINKMKDEKLFASQGGPIVLAQIENEYNAIQLAYRDAGTRYVQWAGKLAIGLNLGIPWVMCKQRDAPDPVINTCNGRNCGDTFTGPNSPDKPALWTENWTAQYRVFGDPPSQRAAEDLAFAVARWFSKNGTLVNYYMYHGGTNFGRTSSSFVTTRYYDEAPLDEFGLQREPKWGHLKDLHSALRLCKKALLWGSPSSQRVSVDLEIVTWEKPGSHICAAFLTNNNSRIASTVKFRGEEYYLPPHSISILPDCKTVVYNSQTIVSQHNQRNFVKSKNANKNLDWEMTPEVIPTSLGMKNKSPLELYSLTKDTSDYAWYTTTIDLNKYDLPMRADILPVLRVASLGHAMLAFVNGEFLGAAHGSNVEKNFVLNKAIKLQQGQNHISILGILVGFPDSGAYMEHRFAGPRAVTILGLNTGTIDLTLNNWGHQVGLDGEKIKVYTQGGSHRVKWTKANSGNGPALTWYKTYFDAPEGTDPVALNLGCMTKGMAWVNGKNIGRHWSGYLSPLGTPSQIEYHVPRAFIKPTDNLLVILEEEGGRVDEIEILTVNRDTICSFVTEYHPPHVKNWERADSHIRAVVDDAKPHAYLKCPNHKVITSVDFASFGDPDGVCGNFKEGKCSSSSSKQIVEQYCMGKESCAVPIERSVFDKGNDGCPDITKTLAIQVSCSQKND